MSFNAIPLMRMLVWPLTTQTQILRPAFALTDDLRHMLKADNIPQVGPLPPTVINGVVLQEPPNVMMPGVIESHPALRWWNLPDEHDGTLLAGFSLEPHRVPYNSLIDRSVAPNPDYHCIEWRAFGEHTELWTSAVPDNEPVGVSGIAWHGNSMDQPCRAQTAKPLPRNQSFHMQLNLLGTAARPAGSAVPNLNLTWGRDWNLLFQPGQPAMLRRRRTNPGRDGAMWDALRTNEELEDPFNAGPLDIDVYHLGGRMVVAINGSTMIYTARSIKEEGRVAPTDLVWNAAPLDVSGIGVAHTLRLSEYQWGSWDTGVGATDGTGHYTRVYNYNGPSSTVPSAQAFGYRPAGGTKRVSGQVKADPSDLATITDAATDKRGERRYKCELNHANPAYEATRRYAQAKAEGEVEREGFTNLLDAEGQPWADYYRVADRAMWGHETPLIHSVALRTEIRTARRSGGCIDLRPAITEAHERVADPEMQAGAMWTVKLNRLLLNQCPICDATGAPSGELVGDNWPDYVAPWHEVTVDVAWQRLPEGTETPWYRRLIGYITAPADDVVGAANWPSTLELRDWIVRLQPPAALIDGSYAPLDLLASEIATNGRARNWGYNLGDSLYGVDAVDYILRTALGPQVADRLGVYFDAATYPDWKIITRDALFNPPNGTGFMWPPPFDSCAQAWIKDIGTADFALFWAGQMYDESGNVVFSPGYGNYFEVIRGMPTVRLADALYETGDLDVAIQSISTRHEPDVDYNRVLVYARPPQDNTDLGGLMPCLPGFSAEALIQNGSVIPEQNIATTWRRTLRIQHPYLYLPRMSSSLALSVASWLKNRKTRHIGIKCRGIPALWWGWKVQPAMIGDYSDSTLDLNARELRVMRIDNDYRFGEQSTWTSSLAVVETAFL